MQRKTVSGTIVAILLIDMLTFAFNIHRVEASGTIYIRADGSIDPPTAPISSVDNVTYTFTSDIYDEIVVERSNIVIDGNGRTLDGTEESGVGFYISGIDNVTIRNTNIKNFDCGISLDSSDFNNITGNNITNNGYYYDGEAGGGGVCLWYSSANGISGNNITNNWTFGIKSYYSSNNTLSGNVINNNGMDGITFMTSGSSNNIISGNNITSNEDDGIDLHASNNIISGNNIADNVWLGIYLHDPDCTISRNNITNNHGGIGLDASDNNKIYGNTISNARVLYGMDGYGIALSSSSNNCVYHNNMVNNTRQVIVTSHIPSKPSENNTWDDGYPSGGNYWSDYTGIDELNGPDQDQPGSDWIGDTPYVIDEDNRDNYPLMNKWFLGDANHDGIVDIVDGGKISAHWYSPPFPEGPLGYNSCADLNRDERVNILDAGIVNANWHRTVDP